MIFWRNDTQKSVFSSIIAIWLVYYTMPRENKRLKNDHRIILIERESCFLLHAPRREERGERRWAWFIARSAPSRWALGRGFIIIFCLIEYNVIHRSIHRRVGAFAFLWRHAIKKGKKKRNEKRRAPIWIPQTLVQTILIERLLTFCASVIITMVYALRVKRRNWFIVMEWCYALVVVVVK